MLAPMVLSCALAAGQATPSSAAPAPTWSFGSDRWLLMKSLQGTWQGACLDENHLRVSGWTDMSFTASTDRVSNLPMGFNYLANNFLLQQNWLRIERGVATSGTTEPTFGFRSDTILPGSDYVFTLARGLFNGQLTADNGKPARYGFDPIQFYAEAYFPTIGRGLDVKFGHFFCQLGVEANDAPSNYFVSHSYTFIFDPFTHTGLLTTLKWTDAWSSQAGLVLGSDNFISPTDTPTFIGNVRWAPPTARDSLQFSVIVGNGRFDQAEKFHNPEVFDFIWVHKCNTRTTYTLNALYGFTTNVPDIGFANWMGLVHYLTRDLTPRMNGTVRLELFDDTQGQRTGFAGLYTAATAGVNLRLRKSIIFRPEIRFDYNPQTAPFEGKHGLFTAASDLVLRW